MVDPTHITNYNLTDHELEERAIFWILVAGKSAKTIAPRLEQVLEHIDERPWKPFQAFKSYKGNLAGLLKKVGIGCSKFKSRSIKQLIHSKINLRTCSVEDLQSVYGIGPKTARCFIVHSRKDARYACLDTHVLRYLRDNGHDAPKETPTEKRYRALEETFLAMADAAKMTPAEYDLWIWNKYSQSGTNAGVVYV